VRITRKLSEGDSASLMTIAQGDKSSGLSPAFFAHGFVFVFSVACGALPFRYADKLYIVGHICYDSSIKQGRIEVVQKGKQNEHLSTMRKRNSL